VAFADALAYHQLARADTERARAHDPARRQEAQQVGSSAHPQPFSWPEADRAARARTRLATQQQRQQQSSASDDSSEPLALAGSGSAQSAEDPSGSAMSPVPAKGAPLGAGVSKEGDVADPRGGDESARRSVEEKVVGLMEEEAV
jgi:hypothetical protein